MSDIGDTTQAYALPPELTIPHAAEVREALLQAVSVGQMKFDAQAVEAIDSSGIQLLLALSKTLQSNGAHLELSAPSTPVTDALRLYGLGDVITPSH